ncbi:MAG: RsmD family RNA methyltransferase [Synergistaceae bacterium]|nr:RsmD family RNA methyltransferase [Synergistaceae bacterium]
MKDVRPTSGKALLALFSILGKLGKSGKLGSLENTAFLDLFAGTGRVGIEALKRGASRVVMVEVSKERARGVERAVPAEFAGTEKVVVLSLELRRAIAWLVRRENAFDVIFADPPYNGGWGSELLHTKNLEKILKREGVLVVEHSSREALDVPPLWAVRDVRVYGETTLTFVELNNPGGISS